MTNDKLRTRATELIVTQPTELTVDELEFALTETYEQGWRAHKELVEQAWSDWENLKVPEFREKYNTTHPVNSSTIPWLKQAVLRIEVDNET